MKDTLLNNYSGIPTEESLIAADYSSKEKTGNKKDEKVNKESKKEKEKKEKEDKKKEKDAKKKESILKKSKKGKEEPPPEPVVV